MKYIKKVIDKKFTDHLAQTGETYLEHLWFTVKMSVNLLYCSIILFIHGLFPFLFTTAVSTRIIKLYQVMQTRVPKKSDENI